MDGLTVLPAFYSRMTGPADAANGPDSLAKVRGLAVFGAVAAAAGLDLLKLHAVSLGCARPAGMYS